MSNFSDFENDVIELLKQIAFSLERSASSSEATHSLYKKANDQTYRAMQAREEREREANERGRQTHQMDQERHDQWMKSEKLRLEREEMFKANALRMEDAKEKEKKGIIDGN